MAKKQIIPCTKEEINKIIEKAKEDDFYYLFFMIAKTTGRKLSEYKEVLVKDIDFERNIMITKVLRNKQKVEKEAILSEEVMELIKKYIKENNLNLEDFLFGEKTKVTIQKAITRYGEKAEIPHKVSFHNFRHYFINELIKKGWSYNKIAKLTGHKKIIPDFYENNPMKEENIKSDALEVIGEL